MIIKSTSRSLIRKYFNQIFDTAVRLRGKNLFNENAVNILEENGNTITAAVLGGKLYRVEIFLFEDRFFAECTCPYEIYCKHAAAVCYEIINSKTITTEPDKKAMNHTRLYKIFGHKPANQFRHLPIPQGKSLEETVRILSIENPYPTHNVSRLRIIRENELEIILLQERERYYLPEDPPISMSLKVETDKILVKCNNCDQVTNRLCVHQSKAFDFGDNLKIISDYIQYPISYDFILDSFADKLGIHKSAIQTYYDLFLERDNKFSLSANSDEIFNKRNEYQIDEFIDKVDTLESEATQEKIKNIESLAKNVNALMWNSDHEIILLKGKKNKRNPETISHIKMDIRPGFFTNNQKEFYYRIEELLYSDPAKVFTHLNSSLEELRSIKHFWNIDPDRYANHNIKKSDLVPFAFSDQPAELICNLSVDEGLDTVQVLIKIKDILLAPSQIQFRNKYFLIYDNTGYIYQHKDVYEVLLLFAYSDVLRFIPRNKKYKDQLLKRIQQLGIVNSPDFQLVNLRAGKKQMHIREVDDHLLFEPSILYDNHRINVFNNYDFIDFDQHKKYLINREEFQQFQDIIKSLHPSWDQEVFSEKFVHLHIDDFLKNQWFFKFFENLVEHNIEVFGQENLSKFKFNRHRGKVNTSLKSGIDWFEAIVDIQFGEQSLDQKEWVSALKRNEQYVKLKDGSIGIIPEEWVERLKQLIAATNQFSQEGLKISKFKFNIIDQLFENIDDEQIQAELAEKRQAINSFEKIKKYPLPAGMNKVLRPYQQTGYQWLKFLDEFEFGGCLADDMGLGKTVQIITLLVDQKILNNGTTLVVIPRSLLFNWAAEIDKFAKNLKYLIYHGPNRNRTLQNFSNYDIIISTYDTVARDIEEIRFIKFNYIVLDESQSIKNPNSQRYKAMRLLKGRNRLAMSGTPIENNTFDLYAQFSFLNPGLFGSQKKFKDSFAVPIDQFGDQDSLLMLKKMIHPFLLRRTKEKVAKDLPEKSESIIYCEMADEQRKLYESLRTKIQKDIHAKVETDGMQKSKFHILDGLLKLRQLCNAPELVDPKLPENKKVSVKIDTLLNIIQEDLGNHRALVFSQFVTMLSLIRKQLDARNIKYAYLDGSTRNREQAVKDFMDDPHCRIFLLSIKAGNTGLNLTEADYVYIVDPWWNPAVEAQAIDRTHRIGQDKNIFAYKMICKDTIEEKIVELQTKKNKLAKDLIQVDENVFKSLKKEELLSLFD